MHSRPTDVGVIGEKNLFCKSLTQERLATATAIAFPSWLPKAPGLKPSLLSLSPALCLLAEKLTQNGPYLLAFQLRKTACRY